MRTDVLQIVGRQSSHYTRLTRVFAEALSVPYTLTAVHDLAAREPEAYGGHPALKLPLLRTADGELFGSENICRAIAARADHPCVVWPEALPQRLSRNAQELVWHAMSAQVQLVFGTMVAGLPSDNLYFDKARRGFEGALAWLDAHLDEALAALPAERDLSLFEASLFCLLDHLSFRATVSLDGLAALVSFRRDFATRPCALRTPYRFDAPA
jgi:glutathione S-transferase